MTTSTFETTSWRQLQQPRRLNWSVRRGHRSIGHPDDWTGPDRTGPDRTGPYRTGQVPIAVDRCQVDNPTDDAVD